MWMPQDVTWHEWDVCEQEAGGGHQPGEGQWAVGIAK